MNCVLFACTLFGCFVYADMIWNSCSQECLDLIKSIESEASSIVRTRTAGQWGVTIEMKPKYVVTDRWRGVRFPRNQNYLANWDIQWPIIASLGGIIMFEVKYMKLQDSTNCQADSVQLFNGVDFNNNKTRMDIFCGNDIGAKFYNSTGPNTLIRFFSNSDAIGGTGFKIRYRAIALPVTTTTTTTTTTTAPTTTTPKPTTTTTILPTTTTTTTTTTKAIKLTTKATTKPTTHVVAPMTTSSTTTSTTTTTTTTTLDTTTTDKTTTTLPTTAQPDLEDDESEENQIESSVLTGSSLSLTIPFCFHHYTNQHILTASKQAQVFKSRGYPLSYPSNLQEEWLIVKPKANDSLSMEVVDADTEYSGNCGYDRVSIYDRSCPDTAARRVFCGTATPSVTLKGNQFALVRFTTDTTNNGRGIQVKYWVNDSADRTEDNSGLDDASLKSIVVGIVIAFGVFCASLGVIRWVMRCRERRKQKAGNGRRHDSEANNSQESSSRTSRRHRHRHSENDGNTTIAVLGISHSGRTRRDSRGGRNSLTDFTGIMVQPPSYNTLFIPGQAQSEIILKPPSYDAKSYEPPPYPGSPVPPPSIGTSQRTNRLLPSVHETRGGNRRTQRRSSQNTTRIVVKPVEDSREEIRSPPPRYEE